MQANTCNLCLQCMIVLVSRTHTTPTYKGLEGEFCSTNKMEYEFGFPHTISTILYKLQQGVRKLQCPFFDVTLQVLQNIDKLR